jgi:hypothetical protein
MYDLKEIQARLDAASPGPWRALAGAKQRPYAEMGYSNAAIPLVLSNNEYVLGEMSAWLSDGDRTLIVNARKDIENLVDELLTVRELLRAVLQDCEEEAVEAARAYVARVEVKP